ncbi:anti-sigma factor family protein [Limobrevibacterium gyesilva]|uniref:Anti-sigma factor n=1 Tax=Limobrevibacterium gyesilva TaxID=2991712 RepID=A0AA41YHA8_9PROT|nr:anti-sigma factor [Limobrevibacterium gyesilva]MCW3473271.1 anti-sigma factor [Limobrevibacterium gyesilva]
MTEPGRHITEEDLHAYVDGRLDTERRAAVDRYLHDHPDVSESVTAFSAEREGLRAAFAERATNPLPPSLDFARLVETRLTRRQAPWRMAAAVALALGLGGASGWALGARLPSGIDALAQEAGASHAVYSLDKRRPVELGAAQRDDLTRWLSNRLNRPVAPPDLSAAGYRLLGGRLVAAAHGAAALFVYENAGGTRLTIYVRPMKIVETTPIEQVDIGDLDGCAWVERGVGYTVIAAEPYKRLLELSKHVRQQALAPI